jgi:hypothetical protein
MKTQVQISLSLYLFPWFTKPTDTDIIQGVEPEWRDDLGTPKRRDPDALPPRNVLELMMNYIYKTAVAMRGGNTLFAIKAATLTGNTFHMLVICLIDRWRV